MSALLDPSNYGFNPAAAPTALAGLLAVALGAFVTLRERGSRLSLGFLAVALAVAWWLLAYALVCLSAREASARWWLRAEHAGLALLPALLYIFSLGMAQRWHHDSRRGWMALVASALLALGVVAGGGAFMAGVVRYPWSYVPRYGPLGMALAGWLLALTLASARLFWAEYVRGAPGIQRLRAQALLQAFVVGGVAAVDLLGGFGVACYPFGYLGALGFLALTARAIGRYRLVTVTPAIAAGQILETMQGLILAVDLDGTIRLCNRSACRLLGYSEPELQGLPFEAVLGSQDDVVRQLEELLREGAIEPREMRWRAKDGREIEVSAAASCLAGSDERPVGALYAAQDLTERRRAEAELARRAEELSRSEAALRQQTRILRLILDSMAEGVVVADEQGKFLLFNPMAEKIIGIGATETAPAQWAQHYGVFLADGKTLASPDELPLVKVIQGAPSAEGEFFIRNASIPQGVLIHASARPLRDERHAHEGGGVVVFHDITARKRSEDELRALNQSLERRVAEWTAEIEARTRELARSNAELEKFAYIASHDLQEPLRVVISYIQLLAKRYRGRLDPEVDEFLHFIVSGVARMQQLIADLLAYSRVGTTGKRFEPVDCAAIARRAAENLQIAVQESQATVEINGLPTVLGDASQLGQVFQNLIGNALKFRRPDVPVRVRIDARRENGNWVLSVRDNGIGIDPQYRDRLFVLFQRLHTQQEYPGTGIGLAICKKIVERHGGTMWVESDLGQGATFSFTLPESSSATGGGGAPPAAAT